MGILLDVPANEDLLRRLYSAFNAGDAETVIDLWITDAEWRPAFIGGGLVEGAVYRGHEGLSEFMRMQHETWLSVNARIVEIQDVGERVLVEVALSAIGRSSGILVERTTWNLFEVSGDKVAVGQVYVNREGALAAARIS